MADIVVPDLGESVVEATISRWLKKEGDTVNVGEPVVVLETDKVDLEVGAQSAGVLARISHPEGADVKIGEVLGVIEPGSAAETPVPAAPQTAPAATPAPAKAEPAEAAPERSVTPVARRMAEQEQIDLAAVAPSSSGRVTKGDVQRYLQQSREAAPTKPAAPTRPPLPLKRTATDARKSSRCRAAAARLPRGWWKRSTPPPC